MILGDTVLYVLALGATRAAIVSNVHDAATLTLHVLLVPGDGYGEVRRFPSVARDDGGAVGTWRPKPTT